MKKKVYMRKEKNSVKLQITLPKEILETIDEELKRIFMSRSQWFLKLATEELQKKKKDVKKTLELKL